MYASERAITIANGFGPRKNVEAALRAVDILSRQDLPRRLTLIGQDMERGGAAKRFADSEGLIGDVDYQGRLQYEQAMDEVAASTLLLHTAREESFGMTILEAMVLGTPVVAGARSGNAGSLLGDGRYGVACDVDDPLAVAAAVHAVVTETDASTQLAERARARALREFSSDIVASQYEAVYADAVGH